MKNTNSFFYCKYSSQCFECCKETEMVLSNEDILRIKKLGYKIQEFALYEDGFYILKNKNGYCVFLKNGKCSIYKNRPEGCKYYPLIFDVESNSVIIDKDCPKKEKFNLNNYSYLRTNVLHFVLRLFKEKEERKRRE
ncbi:MAG: YkgJ family cysteine cluster protein [Candidatus Heimdallarchaeaceae archaeon]